MEQGSGMAAVAGGLPSKAAKIRALAAAGYARADIARFLGIRYQQVRNVLVSAAPGPRHPAPAAPDEGAASPERRVEVRIGPGGRIVIPAAFRAAMAVREGDTLVASVDDDGIVQLTSPAAALQMAQRIVCAAVPAGVSLSGSLIEDRRREAAREAGGDNG